ncbi:hypothetical protein DOTSEDRAFT_61169 [Dothistroma septosporum NZE10]|uniref:Alpha-ketoglutarate-dependent dioxygenase AlkB-like domain-containing protein n=1 Tax=Dothistroma septosporum (strain NZE10 / CBS 128990) TaxID=675120 RepID=N1PSW0_DOTSN|nr:hypothetical protein DOTSEDRAFT_61169 [Dothistroma septosporum NZE10]
MRLEQDEKDRTAGHRSLSGPWFEADKEKESAGSRIAYDVSSEDIFETTFAELKAEVDWQSKYHHQGAVPPLVCCQGTLERYGMPAYRHPSDRTMLIQAWTPTVDKTRGAAEGKVGFRLDHALLQLYPFGKTLDIAHGSNVVKVSSDAQRTKRIRTNSATEVGSQRRNHSVPMPHNFMLTMLLPTNAEYHRSIIADKRTLVELSEAENAYDDHRIRLTFRNIATFLSNDSKLTKGKARLVVDGDEEAGDGMLKAFGTESDTTHVTWSQNYEEGVRYHALILLRLR